MGCCGKMFVNINMHLFFNKNICIFRIYFWLCWVFIAVLRFSLVVASGGDSLVTIRGLLIAVASLVAEHRL